MARHGCDISLKGAMLPGRNDAEMGPAKSLQVSLNTASIMKDFDLIDIQGTLAV